ncbi:MAG: D-2-hydroxyacid dehydrogenase [Eubacterium sp.]|nr:D-2-hydroxyacid dehydrogenase [Eubacterium sp.]
MKNLKIIVSLPITPQQKARLEQAAPSADFYFSMDGNIPEAVLKDAAVLVGRFTPAQAALADRLRFLQLSSAGADLFCAPGVLAPDTLLANASGAYGISVSEHMTACTLALMKNLYAYHTNQNRRLWKDEGKAAAIVKSVVLVIGMGDLGRAYAQRMKALGSFIIGIRRHPANKPDFVDEQYSLSGHPKQEADRILDDCLSRADIVALCLPNTAQTTHIINAARLSHMKPSAYLINAGRGNAVDPDALYEAAVNHTIKGSVLDVTDPEPLPPDHKLWDAPGVYITPHAAGDFHLDLTLDLVVDIAVKNLRHFVNGEPLENLVDRSAGY